MAIDSKKRIVKEPNSEKIINAAIRCFESAEPSKVTMEHIAAAACVDRKTIYRTFENRTALLDEIIIRRVRESVKRVKPVVDICTSIEDAIVKGSIYSLRIMRKDRIFMSILEHANDRGVEKYLIDPKSPVTVPMLSVWQDTFARARARGELRDDLSDLEISTWLRGIQVMLLLRDDLSGKGQEALLKKFVVPALRKLSQQ